MSRIGRFQLIAALKESEQAQVFKGFDEASGLSVLLKKSLIPIHPNKAGDDRLTQEFNVLTAVNHENVVKYLESGCDGLYPYIVMQYVDGKSLRDLLSDSASLPSAIAFTVLDSILAGLQALHDARLIHRDLKPENILLDSEGVVKLIDFDLSSYEADSNRNNAQLTGTHGYIAPEIIVDGKFSSACDLYAAGAIAYEMLTGARPFERDAASAELAATVREPVLRLTSIRSDVPIAFESIILRLLAKAPEDRFATASDARTALENAFEKPAAGVLAQFMAGETEQSAELAPRAAMPLQESSSRRSFPVGYAFLAAALIAIPIVLLSWPQEPPSDSGTSQPLAMTATVAGDPVRADSGARDVDSLTESPALQALAAGLEPIADSGNLKAAELPAFSGKDVYIRSNPWAELSIAGEYMGRADPGAHVFLRAGNQRIELNNPEMPVLHFDISVTEALAGTLHYDLLQHVAQVEFKVTPYAEIYLNGEKLDANEAKKPILRLPGRHNVLFVHPELGSLPAPLQLVAGTAKTLSVNMFTKTLSAGAAE